MFIEGLLLLLCLCIFLYYRLKDRQAFWQRMGVKVPPIDFPFGNNPIFHVNLLLGRENNIDIAKRQYNQMKGEKFYGCYCFHMPALVLTDAELVRRIFIKDFSHFVDRNSVHIWRTFGGESEVKTDKVWASQMAQLNGDKWRQTRSTYSPIFTSGKLKAMTCLVQAVIQKMEATMEKSILEGHEIELIDLCGKFTMDSIASCAFGVDAECFTDRRSEFVSNAKAILRRGPLDLLKILTVLLPGGRTLLNLFGVGVMKPVETKFFYKIIAQTLKQRRATGQRRNDMIDMMVDALREAEGKDGKENLSKEEEERQEIAVVSNALLFLVAGFDTTGQTLSYGLYELAKNPELQRKAQAEVDRVIQENGNQFPSYKSIQSLEYLDMLVYEILRLHVLAGVLTRVCVKDYIIPDTNITLKAGVDVLVNVAGIQHDPKYFPDPMKFDPERFRKGNDVNITSAFFGFGDGPRSCIGPRFALLEAKLVLITLLSKYSFVRTENTVENVTLDPKALLGSSKDPLLVKVVRRQDRIVAA